MLGVTCPHNGGLTFSATEVDFYQATKWHIPEDRNLRQYLMYFLIHGSGNTCTFHHRHHITAHVTGEILLLIRVYININIHISLQTLNWWIFDSGLWNLTHASLGKWLPMFRRKVLPESSTGQLYHPQMDSCTTLNWTVVPPSIGQLYHPHLDSCTTLN
jgi:hypothetical protein